MLLLRCFLAAFAEIHGVAEGFKSGGVLLHESFRAGHLDEESKLRCLMDEAVEAVVFFGIGGIAHAFEIAIDADEVRRAAEEVFARQFFDLFIGKRCSAYLSAPAVDVCREASCWAGQGGEIALAFAIWAKGEVDEAHLRRGLLGPAFGGFPDERMLTRGIRVFRRFGVIIETRSAVDIDVWLARIAGEFAGFRDGFALVRTITGDGKEAAREQRVAWLEKFHRVGGTRERWDD